jgi:hypothetical protein
MKLSKADRRKKSWSFKGVDLCTSIQILQEFNKVHKSALSYSLTSIRFPFAIILNGRSEGRCC